jgi:hypothetical protein
MNVPNPKAVLANEAFLRGSPMPGGELKKLGEDKKRRSKK